MYNIIFAWDENRHIRTRLPYSVSEIDNIDEKDNIKTLRTKLK